MMGGITRFLLGPYHRLKPKAIQGLNQPPELRQNRARPSVTLVTSSRGDVPIRVGTTGTAGSLRHVNQQLCMPMGTESCCAASGFHNPASALEGRSAPTMGIAPPGGQHAQLRHG